MEYQFAKPAGSPPRFSTPADSSCYFLYLNHDIEFPSPTLTKAEMERISRILGLLLSRTPY